MSGTLMVDNFVGDQMDTLVYLYDRWQDEKEYEDINDYSASLITKMPDGMEFVKMTKRPFGLQVKVGQSTYQIRVTASELSWKLVSND